jgi:pyruvate-formate lyase-activating enzyme
MIDAHPGSRTAEAGRIYGDGRPVPYQISLDEPHADFGSGLLIRVQAALAGMQEGSVLRVSSPNPGVATDLHEFDLATEHGYLGELPDSERPAWRHYFLRKGPGRTAWASDETMTPGPATVEALMPRRLWLYTNYDCNLHCDYCCVVSGPAADPRRLPRERIEALVDQAAAAGFERVFITGGEPLIRPDLPDLVAWITQRVPLTLLTNAMLLRGSRWDRVRPLIGPRLTFQVSLDSADGAQHDAHRGAGAHARALAGIRQLLAAGAHVRLAATLPADHVDEIPGLHALADQLGIDPDDRIIRPIALRGAADEGEPLRLEDLAPELTADAEGFFWHPLSNDPDMRIGVPADADLATAQAAVRQRLTQLIAERSVLRRFVCG